MHMLLSPVHLLYTLLPTGFSVVLQPGVEGLFGCFDFVQVQITSCSGTRLANHVACTAGS